jgi:hypothetical protein
MMVLRVEAAFTMSVTSRESGGGFKSKLFRSSASETYRGRTKRGISLSKKEPDQEQYLLTKETNQSLA